ncbi:carbamoyltransferase C-terminal domain-containing protein [Methanocaldococcus fervens]|uniref:Carbamoyltransferase n=1 Tax=Methanocaldococcus fervens (strain DSM 4213 / JCM 15782 / AG86) TaxID=573064 RepID=C7P5X0_METFA|nr:carbamoyltransferase C-terminal domain-containing protein [Methanocaldococcus fervens]ACV23952.1 Carbamoyltransferase [Methanocaldococcus fervens AG86]
MILGICDGHNASSSLITKDEILFAMSEERFTRKKNQRGFPENSINYILNKVKSDEIDYVSIGGVFRRGERIKKLKNFQNKINKKFIYFYHHLAHSYLFKLSDFKEALVISIDGGGDGLSFLASIANKNNLEVVAQSDLIDSVGDFYASITELLGFKPMEDEGKVMSLSSYEGKDDIELTTIDYISELKSFRKYLGVIGYEATKALKKLITMDKNQLSFEDKVRISKFAQRTLENIVLKAIDDLSNEYNIKNIVFVGGVAQNVKLNSKIAERYNLFVPPFMGDEGLCLGASLADKRISRISINNTYFGYGIENKKAEKILEELKNKLSGYKIDFVEERDVPEVVGNLILENKVVCLARGKMEFGPRALGNRSIIALPTKENKEKINKKLKRSWFMPFAPTILYEYVDDYLINPRYSPFMTQIFKVREDKIKEIEGVVHVDKTTRPQTLKKESNKTYYEIIKYIYDCIGIPVILNTSFNLHGEPIVCSEEDAIKSFLKADFDALLLGNYLISK